MTASPPAAAVSARGAGGDAVARPVPAALASVLLALAGAALSWWLPRGWLLLVLVPAQVLLAVAWPALAAVPARLAGAVVAVAAGVAADVLLTVADRPTGGALAGAVGLAVVATVLGQLARRERSEVTLVLAAQCTAVLLTVGVAALAGARGLPHGRATVAVGLLAIAVTVAVGSMVDLAGRRLWLGPTLAGRTLLGALLAVGAALGTGAGLRGGDGVLLALVAAAPAVLADAVAVAVGRPRPVVRLLAAALPLAAAGPALFLVARVLYG